MTVHGNANPVYLVEQGNPVLVIGESQRGVSVIDFNSESAVFQTNVLVLPGIFDLQAFNRLQLVFHAVVLSVI